MAELTPKERLQPSLLDRLRDEEPDKMQESRDKRVLSLQKLRASVVRDLSWLFNCTHLESLQDLQDHPLVAHSVLNYGLPDLAGKPIISADAAEIERRLRQAIWDYEPRILRHSVKVCVQVAREKMSGLALRFDIEGELWAQPMPLKLYLKTEVDLESGHVSIDDRSAAGGA
ncbi:MAG: type VI secretion system baseplate subunit TssE [Gammaproteobacteria bacterium]